MKKVLFIVLAFALIGNAYAQSGNLIFFTENGEGFYAVINGAQQNSIPQTNVKITDLIAPNYKVRIVFKDPSIPSLNKNVMCNVGNEITYNIKRNKKGEFVLRWSSEAPIASTTVANQEVVTYSTTPRENTAVSITETTTTTSTTSDNNIGDENVNMNVSISENGFGMNMNVNVNENGMGVNSSVDEVRTTTTTTTTSTNIQNTQPVAQPESDICYSPMGGLDYAEAKKSISSKSFEDSKMTIAKQVTKSNCMTSEQIKGVVKLFNFEDTRLEYAKYAYQYAFDKKNYYRVNDAFQFETTIEELEEAIGN